MRLDLTLMQISAIKTHLADAFKDDERLMLDTIEGETDAFAMLAQLLNGIEREDGDMAALATQIGDRQARKQRCEARKEARREAIQAIMDCAGVDKLTLPEATLSLRRLPPKAVVLNPDELPDEFCTFTRKPNMAAIKEADTLPPGVTVDNGGVSLTVRRK